MQVYDRQFNELIDKTRESFDGLEAKRWGYDPGLVWKESQGPHLLSRSDTAVELGGNLLGSVNYLCATADPGKDIKDEILLYGPDITQINGRAPLGRIVLLNFEDEGLDERQAFNMVLDLDIARHRVQPEGYVTDFTQANRFESARVSREAVKKGISFAAVGAAYIAQYKKNPRVRSVTVMFVTDPAFDFDRAEAIGAKVKAMMIAMRAHSTIPSAYR